MEKQEQEQIKKISKKFEAMYKSGELMVPGKALCMNSAIVSAKGKNVLERVALSGIESRAGAAAMTASENNSHYDSIVSNADGVYLYTYNYNGDYLYNYVGYCYYAPNGNPSTNYYFQVYANYNSLIANYVVEGLNEVTLYLGTTTYSGSEPYYVYDVTSGEYLGYTMAENGMIGFYLKAIYEYTGQINFLVFHQPATPIIESFYTYDGYIEYEYNCLKCRQNIDYVGAGNNNQKMDIHIPDNLLPDQRVPALITLHGGIWSALTDDNAYFCDKSYYNYMTEFITEDCNCVHVNMNYRLLGTGGGLDTSANAKLPYEQMLEDIQSVIDHLHSYADIYHINPEKIALMGYSAGGHLALLYAYSTAESYSNPNDNPIKLVISEAGPTDIRNWSTISNIDEAGYYAIEALVNSNNSNKALASPYCIVNTTSNKEIFPYTILAYGDGLYTHGEVASGDGLIPFSQATVLQNMFDGLDNPEDHYVLYTFNGVGHTEFGEGSGKVVYPNTDVNDEELNQIIDDYYEKISSKLQELAQQED